jgi:sugar/nucleoside kinase (ribokinase family)
MNDEQRSGQCLVLVTPDAQRTMCTDLGVSKDFSYARVNESDLRAAKCLYIEGYLSASELSSQSAARSAALANASSTQVALTLSDISMIEFCRDGLSAIIGDGVDTLFCNADEATAWAKTDRLDIAISELKDIAKELYVTLGSEGAEVCNLEGRWQVGGESVVAVDTNGAGDMFAGACLAARLQGAEAIDAARFANRAAARVITQFGARLPSLTDYQLLRATE